jgi:predicted PurR-regulated permease PerM
MEINPNKLLDNFKNMKNYVNLNLLVCTKTLFSKRGISKNIGSYLIIVIILFQIICIFVFYLKQLNSLKDQIKKIIYAINHLKVIKGKKEEETNNKENKEIENEIKIDNNIKTTNDINEKKIIFQPKKEK